MHKRSLLFDVQLDGASPVEECHSNAAQGPRRNACALVKIEPVPTWLALFNRSIVKK